MGGVGGDRWRPLVNIGRNALRCLAAAVLGAATLLFLQPALADEPLPIERNTFGEVGLLEMPSARMAPDGQLSVTLGGFTGNQHASLGFQVFPWLEGSFRYSRRISLLDSNYYYDRSFGLKLRLFQETRFTPDVSLGVRDLIGTGIYGAEYVVLSKALWDFDLTAGLGWGRLASSGTFKNPFGLISSKFYHRNKEDIAGKLDLKEFFRGPDMGIFGGIAWHTPLSGLSLTAEYSSDRYVDESGSGGFTRRSPFNFGLTYAPSRSVSLTAGWFYGDSAGAVITFAFDPTSDVTRTKLDAPPLGPVLRPPGKQQTGNTEDDAAHGPVLPAAVLAAASNLEIDGSVLLVDAHAKGRAEEYCRMMAAATAQARIEVRSVAITDLDMKNAKVTFCPVPTQLIEEASYSKSDQKSSPAATAGARKKILEDAEKQALTIDTLQIGGKKIVLYYENPTYESEAEAIGRLSRILMADAPAPIETFHLVAVYRGVPAQAIAIDRKELERAFANNGAGFREAIRLRAPPLCNPVLEDDARQSYPRFSWSAAPALRIGLFDPDQPLQAQFFANVDGGVEVLPGLSISANLEGNIYNTFSTKRASNSVLPHVRSDIAEYLNKGATGIAALSAGYTGRLRPGVFFKVKAGYLESMFAGAGGQVLWRPENSRWAVGADLYEVWQRKFDRLFGLQRYHVLTGHVSVYYQSPWYGINLALHAGRYLARDRGVTIEISRRFSTGVEIGAFATFTNVPASQFGEGSFDKGIMIHIPLEWALPYSTQSSFDWTLRPLTRDGGQRLAGDDSLYEETERTSYNEIARHADDILFP